MDYMKLFVGEVVDGETRGSCIPTDSMKSGDDYPILVHNTEIGAYIDSDKTNLAYLVGYSVKLFNVGLVISELKEVGVKYEFKL